MSFLSPKPYGSVHGRFQGVHLDHEEYILRSMAKCAHLFVGLALPNPNGLSKESPQSRRHDPTNNPFSYYERTQMLRGCLLGAGYRDSDFTIHPFPIDQMESVSNYLPAIADMTLFVTVYSDWSRQKAQTFRQHGYKVETFSKDPMKRQATGSELRRCMRNKEDFSSLVSPSVKQVIEQLGLDRKLAEQSAE